MSSANRSSAPEDQGVLGARFDDEAGGVSDRDSDGGSSGAACSGAAGGLPGASWLARAASIISLRGSSGFGEKRSQVFREHSLKRITLADLRADFS
jgi:hypothetical protein